jgi:hypothetical protein
LDQTLLVCEHQFTFRIRQRKGIGFRATLEWRRTPPDQSLSIIRKVHKRFRQLSDDFFKRFNFAITGFELTVAVMKEEDPWDKTHLPGKREDLFSLSGGMRREHH